VKLCLLKLWIEIIIQKLLTHMLIYWLINKSANTFNCKHWQHVCKHINPLECLKVQCLALYFSTNEEFRCKSF